MRRSGADAGREGGGPRGGLAGQRGVSRGGAEKGSLFLQGVYREGEGGELVRLWVPRDRKDLVHRQGEEAHRGVVGRGTYCACFPIVLPVTDAK